MIDSVQPLVAKSKELRAKNSVISYFCQYLAIQKILESGQHNETPEIAQFVAGLLDELETMKAQMSTENQQLLTNAELGSAYAADFASVVFTKAVRATETNTVSKQTAGMFLAAAVFLNLEEIWGEVDVKTREKIQYAKYQATRILKAVRANKDPNELYEGPEGTEGTGEEAPEEARESASESKPVDLPEDAPVDDHTHADHAIPPKTPPKVPTVPAPVSTPAVPVNAGTVAGTSAGTSAGTVSAKEVLDLTSATNKAQKHAKYAISALNYDDLKTAISELEHALSTLKTYQSEHDD